MTEVSAEPEAIRTEAGRWIDRAEEMTGIRQATAGLGLGVTAFFPGFLAEVAHFQKYSDCLREIILRLEGATVEFELIGVALRNIAAGYEEEEQVTVDNFRVTERELDRVEGSHVRPGEDVRDSWS